MTTPAIEASCRTLLAILYEHSLVRPYLLGGRPSNADFGLTAPTYAVLQAARRHDREVAAVAAADEPIPDVLFIEPARPLRRHDRLPVID